MTVRSSTVRGCSGNSEPRHRPDVLSWRWRLETTSDRLEAPPAPGSAAGAVEQNALCRITARPINFPRSDIDHPPASRQAVDFDALRRSKAMSTGPMEKSPCSAFAVMTRR